MFRAVLWDVDGTLAETERDGHRVAFNLAFEAYGLPWRWDEDSYGALLEVTGGRERLLHDMDRRADAPKASAERERLAAALHQRKNAIYGELVREGGIPLREGVLALLHECRMQGVRVAITTTTSRANVEALLRAHEGAGWRDGFEAVVCGEDVHRKKPDPEAHVRTLQALALGPLDGVAIEDSPVGAAAARAAGIPVVVTRSHYFGMAAIEGAIAVGPGLHSRIGWRPSLPDEAGGRPVGLDDLRGWFLAAQKDKARTDVVGPGLHV
jgi:HAD superfamily hydrolase (TIGR01509 family)